MTPIPWTTSDVLAATGGRLCFGDPARRYGAVSTDSRNAAPGEIFIAIRGEVHDGHDFAEAAVRQGATGVLADRSRTGSLPMERWSSQGITCIAVEDTIGALGRMASHNRQRAAVTVVAITGSNGKTTTREMTAAVVSTRYCTLTPRGNFNNEIGLPLTLLTLAAEHRLAVLELGMNHPGEIRRLGDICSPDIGMITNIGPAHLEGVGSIEGVARAKAELLDTIRPDGTVVLNADDARVAVLADRTGHRVVTFGRAENARIRGVDVRTEADGTRFTLLLPGASAPVRLNVPGTFMVSNALAAAATGHLLGLTIEQITSGLEAFHPVKGRLNIVSLGRGIRVIDDTYNANPESMAAAFGTLASLRGDRRAFVVAGDMLELGEQTSQLHRWIGEKAAAAKVDRLYLFGPHAGDVAAGAVSRGMDGSRILTGDKQRILDDLTARLGSGDWVLVKGSRGMRMETIVQGLKEWADDPPTRKP